MADQASMLDPDLEPDISHLVTEDDEPVDNIFSERQQRLLVDCLYTSWTPEDGRTFVALANVGLFFALHKPPVVPDAMLSLDVTVDPEYFEKRNRSYLVWEFGKPPDVVIEVVSNQVGGEEEKLVKYDEIGVRYYAIYDPEGHLSQRPLRVFERHGGGYVEMLDPSSLPYIGLGLILWEGQYEGMNGIWLRWCDAGKRILPTGGERADQERERAYQERERADQERKRADQERERACQAEQRADEFRQRANQERQRADRLAERLRELGGDAD